ncbi:MAG: phosphatidylethanolamine N-methyltransferase family protein [Candidatus Krumholzibacteria bacterium]|nr:phosphatidylethanolamine N-methyltransferase family protein [Candidatus Krumholzibacteria bacterium]
MFERQLQHYLALALLLVGVWRATDVFPGVLAGELWGVSTAAWLAVAILVAIVHQFYVWLVWRAELHHAAISRRLGRERGFALYSVGFAILIDARLAAVIILAVSNAQTLALNATASYALAVVLSVPMLHTLVSVHKYFGVKRAFGIDHFDPAYREMPFVRQGIFRFTGNAMYTFGILLFWIPGLVLLSQAALVAAIFTHLYIWVHYETTELPDIRRIYGRAAQ